MFRSSNNVKKSVETVQLLLSFKNYNLFLFLFSAKNSEIKIVHEKTAQIILPKENTVHTVRQKWTSSLLIKLCLLTYLGGGRIVC